MSASRVGAAGIIALQTWLQTKGLQRGSAHRYATAMHNAGLNVYAVRFFPGSTVFACLCACGATRLEARQVVGPWAKAPHGALAQDLFDGVRGVCAACGRCLLGGSHLVAQLGRCTCRAVTPRGCRQGSTMWGWGQVGVVWCCWAGPAATWPACGHAHPHWHGAGDLNMLNICWIK